MDNQSERHSPKSSSIIGQYVILGLLLVFAVMNIIYSFSLWAPGDVAFGGIIMMFLLFLAQIFFALIGFILSIIGIVKSRKNNNKVNLKINIIFLGLFVLLPIISFLVNGLMLHLAGH